jgi:hypothetical protein
MTRYQEIAILYHTAEMCSQILVLNHSLLFWTTKGNALSPDSTRDHIELKTMA